MSTLWLKILACAAMLADHIGFFSNYGYPELELILRGFGRIAFPIFCYLIAFGYRKTSDKFKYLLRLIIIGLLSELPFYYCFYGRLPNLSFSNVYFTLALGLLSIILFDYISKSGTRLFFPSLLAVIPPAALAALIGTDYGADGVLLIFFFCLAGTNKAAITALTLLFASRKFIIALAVALGDALPHLSAFSLPAIRDWDKLQILGALALLPILLCDGSRGYRPKSRAAQKVIQYSFYLFYPVHLLVLGVIIREFVM